MFHKISISKCQMCLYKMARSILFTLYLLPQILFCIIKLQNMTIFLFQ